MATAQTLIIAVKGHQAAQFGSRSQKAFAGRGGSIGRSDDCDWVLSAAGVSRVHAMIRFLNGIYFIEDRSTNGMLLNGVALVRGDPSPLKDGDCLQIDTFEMAVRLQSATEAAAPPAAAAAASPALPSAVHGAEDFGLLDLLPQRGGTEAGPLGDELIPDAGHSTTASDLDPLSFLDAPFASEPPLADAPAGLPAASWNHSAGMEDHFRPPSAASAVAPQALPENWDMTMGDFTPKVAAPQPIAPPPAPMQGAAAAAMVAPTTSAPVQLAAVTAGTPMLPAELAQMLHVVADGVMDVLRARAEIKNSFRLPVTIIQRSENNPLKFAATAEEAVQKILAPPNTTFLSGAVAFDDAFDDIRCHQMAMLAGVRAGFDALLAHFNPDRFEREADGGAKRSAFAGKGRYWEKYREHFEGLMKDPDECFRRLFGDEFARAYEVQLSRLKSARKAEQSTRR
ncbi:MAG: type VI secretion system-associated FHA domain protein TagH [Metallibacterium sp.]